MLQYNDVSYTKECSGDILHLKFCANFIEEYDKSRLASKCLLNWIQSHKGILRSLAKDAL